VGLLALCPLIAGGRSLLTAACISLGFVVTLVLVSITLAGLGRGVATDFRVLTIFVVSAIWVTVYDLAFQAAVFPLSIELNQYIPLLAANSLVFAIAEQSLRGGGVFRAARRAAVQGAHASCWLIPAGLFRELLGTGRLFAHPASVSWLPDGVQVLPFALPALAYPMWGFLLLGMLTAVAAAAASGSRAGASAR
jgi:Na+-translocating ferredoxin:NAD+ oxidoreductase RnfE subunit